MEIQGIARVVQTGRAILTAGGFDANHDTYENVLEWNLGHMVNLGPTWALGGVVTLGTGSDGPLTGVKLRARRWLSPDLSLELEGGLLRSNAHDTRFPPVNGVTADVRLNLRDQGSVFVRWDGLPLSEEHHGNGYGDPGGFQQALSLGLGLGSTPALVGSAVTGVTIVVLFAHFLSEAE